jgi:SAM-dependent methyltransferase
MTEQKGKNWCEDFYDDHFAEHHLVRADKKELDDTIRFFEEKLHLRPGCRIFDQCCGIGSLSIALAGKGYKMNGVDLIPSYISRAQRDALNAGAACRFESGDAYTYTTPEPCDAAINWWTSFGYTPDDRQNMEILHCVHKSLKPGGRFALDYMNAPQRLMEFGGGTYTRSETKKGDYTSIWESHLDHANNMIVKNWRCRYLDGREIVKQGGGAKLYTKDDLEQMFKTCGFGNVHFYGSIAGETLTDSSPRCIVVAEKI